MRRITEAKQPADGWFDLLKSYPDWDINMIKRLWFAASVSRGTVILDIGGGNGALGQLLKMVKNVDGSDIQYQNADVVTGFNVESGLSFKDRAYHTVYLIDVIDHLEEPVEAIAEGWRLAAKRLVLSISPAGPGHIWSFEIGEIEIMLDVAGAYSVSSFALTPWNYFIWADRDKPLSELKKPWE